MSLYPKNLNEYVALMGVPRGPLSQVYIVDTVNGDDNNDGKRWLKPMKTVTAALDKCVADQHDAVVMLPGDTADTPEETVVLSKDFTHILGAGGDLNGVGQRCRIVGTAANDLTKVMEFTGKGCVVKNLQVFNGADADADSGAVDVSGGRNYFENVFFAGMGHATPAARAGSYSLKLTGEENLFKRCAVGLDTIVRAAANAELVVDSASAARNAFRGCRVLSASETAGKFAVNVNNMDRWLEFEDCIFQNFSANWAQSLTNAFKVGASATHYIVLRGRNQLVGYTGWADTVTHLYSAAPQPNAGFGVSTQPTT